MRLELITENDCAKEFVIHATPMEVLTLDSSLRLMAKNENVNERARRTAGQLYRDLSSCERTELNGRYEPNPRRYDRNMSLMENIKAGNGIPKEILPEE